MAELEEALKAGDLLHLSTVIADWKADADYADLSLHDFIQLRGRVVPMEQRAPYTRAERRCLQAEGHPRDGRRSHAPGSRAAACGGRAVCGA